MMRVLVFEQWRGGHYFDYLKCLLPRLSELASEVVVTLSRRALESEEFEAKIGAYRAFRNIRFEPIIPDADPSLPLRERLTLLMNVRNAIAHTKPDYVLVTSADAQTLAMGALGHIGITLLPKNIPSEATFHTGYGSAVANLNHLMKEAVYRFAVFGMHLDTNELREFPVLRIRTEAPLSLGRTRPARTASNFERPKANCIAGAQITRRARGWPLPWHPRLARRAQSRPRAACRIPGCETGCDRPPVACGPP